MVLDTSLLNTQHYNVHIKGRVEQSREGVAPFPTPQCSSYWKESLRVIFDYSRHFTTTYTILYYIIISLYFSLYLIASSSWHTNIGQYLGYKTKLQSVVRLHMWRSSSYGVTTLMPLPPEQLRSGKVVHLGSYVWVKKISLKIISIIKWTEMCKLFLSKILNLIYNFFKKDY